MASKGGGQAKKYGLQGGVTMNNYTFKCGNEGLCNSSLRGRRLKGREKGSSSAKRDRLGTSLLLPLRTPATQANVSDSLQ